MNGLLLPPFLESQQISQYSQQFEFSQALYSQQITQNQFSQNNDFTQFIQSQIPQSQVTQESQFVLTSDERAALYREHAQERIEEEFLNMINQVVSGKKPYLIQARVVNAPPAVDGQVTQPLKKRKTSNSSYQTTSKEGLPHLPLDQMYVRFAGKLSQRKYTLLIHLMAKIYGMAVKIQFCTIRDMYYEDVTFYGKQSRLESGLYDLCHILKVPRDALRMEATAKGVMAGNLQYKTAAGDLINLTHFKFGMLIPGPSIIDNIYDIESSAKQIIVVEKDAVFQRLIGEGLLEDLGPTILITGKGYPDLVTLKMIRKLRDRLNLKVFALVDCDPYGVEIASIIQWGSYKQASIAKCTNDLSVAEELTVPDLIWIGLLPSEIGELSLTGRASSVMTPRDKKKLESVKRKISTKNNPIWTRELDLMQQSGIKAELEALFLHPRFANFYIKQKLNSYFMSKAASNQ